MGETLTVGHRFCGPPIWGNGGWVSGSLAGFVDGPAEITLRRPPPLGSPLEVVHGDDITAGRPRATMLSSGKPTISSSAGTESSHMHVWSCIVVA